MPVNSHGPISLIRANIVIIDSRRLSREALWRLLDTAAFSVVGAGAALNEAVAGLHHEDGPDLFLHHFDSDAEMAEAIPQIMDIRARYPKAKSVVLSDCADGEVLNAAMQTGVEAFLSRDISSDVLQRALELVFLGQRILPQAVPQPFATPIRAEPMPAEPATTSGEIRAEVESVPACALSKREYQILKLLVAGQPNKAIARELDISEATVKVHVKGLLRKTRLTNRTQAAIWGLHHKPWERFEPREDRRAMLRDHA